MLQLRCTKKVLDQFRVRKSDLAEPEASDGTLGNWFVNGITIERRKTLVFMSERTLLSFILFGVWKTNSDALGKMFAKGFVQLLELEGFTRREIAFALRGCDFITVAKTDNRKTMGNMNDLARHYEHRIWYEGGFKSCDLWAIISSVNRMPQRNIGWGYSIDLTRELIVSKSA